MTERPVAAATTSPRITPGSEGIAALALGAMGVVYGDIGTSPLYAVRECFIGAHALPITPENVLGVLSLIFWSLTMVVSVKYLAFVMRADNHGEGGILALLALIGPVQNQAPRKRSAIVLLGLVGAALLYGDGVITPAISVLSAVEGLQVATHALEPLIVPLAVVILFGLFLVQHRGTAKIGAVFGPAMLVWFAVIGCIGVTRIWGQPAGETSVLVALNPAHAVELFFSSGSAAFWILGSVVLCITGGEALYADMGHFGRKPIRLAWYTVALPGLLLNYFGQGALLLEQGSAVRNPFFEAAPEWALYPLVGLSTVATIIASQALISGVFSLTQQAVQLGYSPRVTIVHTSGTTEGQIYVPEVNWGLMVMCILLVLGFRNSSALAGAYGIAVTGTMAVTSVLYYVVARQRWDWSPLRTGALLALFLVFDLGFFGANIVKVADGGWFPILVAVSVFTVMTTWKRGRAEMAELLSRASLPMNLFLADLSVQLPHRVDGTAVVMTSTVSGVPPVLLHHFKHNKVLHKRVVLLSIVSEKRPEVADEDRIEIIELGEGFYRLIAHFGFMESPRMSMILDLARSQGMQFDLMSTTFFLGRETLLPTGPAPLAKWRKRLFAIISRNAPSATAFFEIPPNRVVELGAQLEL